jgi:hypothetical protein
VFCAAVGAERVKVPEILSFLSAVNSPDVETAVFVVCLLAAFGYVPALVWQAYVVVAVALAVIPFRFVDGIMKAWQRYSTHG